MRRVVVLSGGSDRRAAGVLPRDARDSRAVDVLRLWFVVGSGHRRGDMGLPARAALPVAGLRRWPATFRSRRHRVRSVRARRESAVKSARVQDREARKGRRLNGGSGGSGIPASTPIRTRRTPRTGTSCGRKDRGEHGHRCRVLHPIRQSVPDRERRASSVPTFRMASRSSSLRAGCCAEMPRSVLVPSFVPSSLYARLRADARARGGRHDQRDDHSR
jgi:hypothetical protein